MPDYQRLSLVAVILFALLALAGLLLAALVFGNVGAVKLALVAIGATYASQTLTTWAAGYPDDAAPAITFERAAVVFQGAAIAAFLLGLFALKGA